MERKRNGIQKETDRLKIKKSISDSEDRKAKLFFEMGMKTYYKIRKRELSTEDFEEICDEIKNLVQDTNELLMYQSREDSEEDLKKIPMLSLKDIKREVSELKVDKYYGADGTTVYHYDTFTGGIAYISAIFDVRGVKEEDISYIGLMSDLIVRTGTKKKNHIALSNEIMCNLGGLDFYTKEYSNKNNSNEYIPTITVSSKVLSDKLPKAIDLMAEIISDASFEDEKKIKEIIKERISDTEMNMLSKGHIIATSRMNSYYHPLAKYKQKVSGLEYYNFLKEIDSDIDNKISEIKKKLYEVKSLIFNAKNMQLSIIGSEKEKDLILALANELKGSIGNKDIVKNKYLFTEEKLNEGLLIPSEVQYVAKGYNFKNLGYEYDSSIEVLKNVLRYGYLWNKVRVQGGAYGAMINATESGIFTLCSYRDPHIRETIDAYNGLADFVENINLSDRELEKAIIGTISDNQLPTTPLGEGVVAIDCAITDRTKEDRQSKRDKILNTTIEDLRKHASLIRDVMNQDCQVAVGNEKIKECTELFNEVYSVLK